MTGTCDCHIQSAFTTHLVQWSKIHAYFTLFVRTIANREQNDVTLITFPSVDDQQRRVTMQYVDGYYDFGKTRSNKAEAKAIVTEVLDRLRKQLPTAMGGEDVPLRSIGILASRSSVSK